MTVDYAPDAPQPPVTHLQSGQARGKGDFMLASPGAESIQRPRRGYAADAVSEQPVAVEAQPFQAVYAIAGRVAVPSTNEMKRVQIDDMALDPTLTVRTVPKAEAKAYLYAKLTMAAGTPVLPGPVALFRDSIFVGNGQLPLLAPGEEHELGFGVDDMIRVRHAIADQMRGESGWVSSSKTDVRNYRITVKNMHQRPIQVRVLDQIPVSQNEAIKIDLTGRTQPTRRNVDDKRGVLAWDMTLAPDEEKVVEFGYRVSWPAGRNVTYAPGS
jgi:uncharacterized protein (TIGR02231 family)